MGNLLDIEHVLATTKRQRAYDEYDDVVHIETAIVDRGVLTIVQLVKRRIVSMDKMGWFDYGWGIY
jgi:hypothetical protein